MERQISNFFSKLPKVLSFIDLGRPWNGALSGLMSIIGALMFSIPSLIILIGMFFSFLILYMGGAILNDLSDMDIDCITMPYRPIQSGRITVRQAIYFSIFLYILSILISLMIGLIFFFGIFISTILSITYSVKPISLVRRGLAGILNLGVVTILIPAYSGACYSLNSLLPPINFWLLFLSFTSLATISILTKDFKDSKGDGIKGKKTLIIIYGKKKSMMFITIGTVIFYPFTIYFFYLYIQNFIFILLSPIFLILLLFIENKFYSYMDNQKDEEKGYAQIRIILLFFILTIFGFQLLKLFYS